MAAKFLSPTVSGKTKTSAKFVKAGKNVTVQNFIRPNKFPLTALARTMKSTKRK